MKRTTIMGVILLLFLIVSLPFTSSVVTSLHELPTIQSIDIKNLNKRVYVDSNLYLSEKHLPLLESTLEKNNNEINEIIKQIIFVIEQKGFVNSQDMFDILDKANSEIASVHFMKFIATEIFSGSENVFHFPYFIPHYLALKPINSIGYIGPLVFLYLSSSSFVISRLITYTLLDALLSIIDKDLPLLESLFNYLHESAEPFQSSLFTIGFVGALFNNGLWNVDGYGLLTFCY